MKDYLKIFTLFLLLFNTVGAFYGGMNSMLYPDGSGLGMETSLLQYSPFQNFFIPGLILFLINGLFGLYVFIAFLKSTAFANNLVMIQGVLLAGWILAQVLLIRMIFVLHPIMLAIGLLLVVLGLLQRRFQQSK